MNRNASTTSAPDAAGDTPADFFSSLVASHDETARRLGGATSFQLAVADRPLTIEFAGSGLADVVMPALRHLAEDGSRGGVDDFRIKVFESANTGVTVTPPPWGAHDYLARGEIKGFNDDRFRTVYRIETGTLSMMDIKRRTAVFWIRDLEHYPTWMVAAPLRSILSWWAATYGLQFAHGAAVGLNGRGVLITAPGGSGKSTTAVRCALSGLDYLGDDYVIVDPAELTVHSVYASAKADSGAVDQYFPQLRPKSQGRIGNDGSGKHVFFATELFPERLATSLDLVAVAIPGFTSAAESSYAGSDPGKALAALAPTTVLQLAGASGRDLRTIASMLRRVPCFDLAIAAHDDVSRVVRAILTDSKDDR